MQANSLVGYVIVVILFCFRGDFVGISGWFFQPGKPCTKAQVTWALRGADKREGTYMIWADIKRVKFDFRSWSLGWCSGWSNSLGTAAMSTIQRSS
nr:hypothetical protein [Tanacetum cinerariifolium]